MKDFEALKDIWNGQAAEPKISFEDLIRQLKRSRRRFSDKLLLETAGMLCGVLIFAWVWVSNPFLMWTTHLSLFIFILCCLYYIVIQLRDYKSISNSEYLLQEPEGYIMYLKNYRRHRYLLNTRNYAVYSIFIGIAFGLYFVEVYFVAPLWQTVTGLLFTAAWFIVCWRLMRIYMRREQERLYEMIRDLERIRQQFSASDESTTH